MMYCLGYQPRLTMVTLQATTGHLVTVGKSPVCDRSIESRMNVVGMGDWQASRQVQVKARGVVVGLSTIAFGWSKENGMDGLKRNDEHVVPLGKEELMAGESSRLISVEVEW